MSSLTERDITIDALIKIIQDPDKGVPRPPANALKDVQIKKGVFSVDIISERLLESCLIIFMQTQVLSSLVQN